MKKKNKPVLIVCLLILFVGIVGIIAHLIVKYTPTREKMDLYEYYGQVSGEDAAVVMGTQLMEERGAVGGDQAYLPIDMVNTWLNQRYYWDGDHQEVLYASPSRLMTFPASDTAGGDVWLKDGTVYLSLPFIGQYTDIETYVYENPSRIAVQYQFTGLRTVSVLKNGSIRYRGGIKSPVLTEVKDGDSLILLEELEDWVQVATRDGYVGYIEKKKVGIAQTMDMERSFEREQYVPLTMEEPVNMSWHQITSAEGNDYLKDAIQDVSGVNVISPTWFSIADNEGNLRSIASSQYVETAHEAGLKVWGLVDNFSEDIKTMEVLSHTDPRQNVIRQLMDAALEVGMDGINVDFEYLSEEVGVHFLEFLRELSIECHKNGLVLSVDNPVPEDFTSHYDRAEQGRVVDYVIVMGYDEHYVGSEEAGSVASLPWVEKGIQDTLKEVPPERVINAIPFYTRLWKTTGGILSSEAIGMDQAQEVIAQNHADTYWDKNLSQNYGTFDADGSVYQIWIEDAQSIAEKVKLIPKYGLAGVAQWKLGFENSGIWQVISDNLR